MFVASVASAAPYLHTKINTDGVLQGAAPDPLQTIKIADDYSHTYSVTGNIWYDLVYQGSGTCIIRLMNTNAKESYTAETVTQGQPHTYLIHGNTNFINYSGCKGSSPANSVIHFQ